jgi:predicted RNA-binding protein YlxR (DUF448 family)
VTRGGRKKAETEAERRCIVTGDSQPRAGLIRFVVGPDDHVVPDIQGKLPGRGMWVSADRDALVKAVQKKQFSRSAKKQVLASETLPDDVEALLVRQIVSMISLARKGGKAITGFEKVKDAAVLGTVAVLIQASDGSPAQLAKIRPPKGENTLISCLSAQELGVAFGRENVIHAALVAGGLEERVVEEAARLAGIRKFRDLARADVTGTGPEQEGVKDV